MADINVNFANDYSKSIELLVTTPTGAFDGKVAEGSITGAEDLYWEQLGGAVENEITESNGQQVYRSLQHYRRKVFTSDYELPLMLDKHDEMRVAVDFKSNYVQRTVEAYKRSRDIECIKGVYNPAYTGKNGTTATAFDFTNQTVAVTLGAASGFTNAGMTKEKLIAARSKLKRAGWDLNMPRYTPYMVMSQTELDNLIATTETQSRDFSDLQSLSSGEISRWMGFEFIFTEMVPYVNTAGTGVHLTWDEDSTKGVRKPTDTDSTDIRGCFAYVKDNIGCYSTENFTTEAGKIERFRYSWGLYAAWSHGAVRRQEDGAVFVPCDVTPAAA